MAEPTLLQQAREHLHTARAYVTGATLRATAVETAVMCILRHLEVQAAEDAARQARYARKVQDYAERVRGIDAGLGDPAQGNTQPASVIAEDNLTELERLCTEATAAPWMSDDSGDVFDEDGETLFTRYLVAGGAEDGAFIAKAREALPKLIAEVRRLRGELERTAKELEWNTTKNDARRAELERELWDADGTARADNA